MIFVVYLCIIFVFVILWIKMYIMDVVVCDWGCGCVWGRGEGGGVLGEGGVYDKCMYVEFGWI